MCSDPGLERALAGEALAFEKDRHGALDADEARQPLRAARAGKQADQRFRQTDRGVPVVGQHAIMRGQRQFAASAKRQPCDRGSDRLAAGFERAKREAQPEEMIVGGAKAAWLWRRHDFVVGGPDFRQVRARAKARRLARADQGAADVRLFEPARDEPDFDDRRFREHVHRAAGRVEDDVGEPVSG